MTATQGAMTTIIRTESTARKMNTEKTFAKESEDLEAGRVAVIEIVGTMNNTMKLTEITTDMKSEIARGRKKKYPTIHWWFAICPYTLLTKMYNDLGTVIKTVD